MVFTKVDPSERFNGDGDFSLWQQRMYAILIQLKVAKALKGPAALPDSLSADQKDELMELAYSTIILHLGDKVLRQIKKLKTAAEVWLKLESLYMTKTLTNRVFLKGKLMNFKILDDKPLDDYLDDFAKLIIDLENIDVEIDMEDQALIILNALPPSYSNFVETMRYSRDSISLDDVISALRSKVIESGAKDSVGEGLVVKKGKGENNKGHKKGKNDKNGKQNAKNNNTDDKPRECGALAQT